MVLPVQIEFIPEGLVDNVAIRVIQQLRNKVGGETTVGGQTFVIGQVKGFPMNG